MFSNTDHSGRAGPTTRFAPSGLGELPLDAPLPSAADAAARRRLALVEGAAITALVTALALELGVALGLY